MKKMNTILIANRGEIAVRIIKAAREMGYRTVAVHSTSDADALHVASADEAIEIGPSPASESYLDPSRIFAAVEVTGADAIHPGYGFLSENAEFARACVRRGLTFIGPDADAIALMGDKAAARQRMAEAGVPCVPGYDGHDQTEAVLLEAAAGIGFPVMVKAAMGGGGRGMRLVEDSAALPSALVSARSEAENAFGSGELVLEKAILRPRHVEVQIFADAHGGVVHLGERDCSVQRRHQKVLEEAPGPAVNADLRERMGAAAVAAASAVDYRGAGTVEFLLDADGVFYFLEMNTRIQVEHPVTEAVTGRDLVVLQLRVAEGLPLGFKQDDVTLTGHAIEARLYAEDPARDFLPSTGRVDLWRPPSGAGVRCDGGLTTTDMVSPYYDPLLAKIIAYGGTREVARTRLIEALRSTVIFGPQSNRGFLIGALERETFASGAATTAFIAEEYPANALAAPEPEFEEIAIAAVLLYRARRDQSVARAVQIPAELLDWSSGGHLVSHFAFGGWNLTVTPDSAGGYVVRGGGDHGQTLRIERVREEGCHVRLRVEHLIRTVQFFVPTMDCIRLSAAGRDFSFEDELAGAVVAADAAASGGEIAAPMHGTVLDVFVQLGDQVAAGDRLAVLEAMKMQHDIVATADGEITEVFCRPASQIAADAKMFELALDEK